MGLDDDDGTELRCPGHSGGHEGADHGASGSERGGARHGGAHAGGEGCAFGCQELASIGCDKESGNGTLQPREGEGGGGDGEVEAGGLEERKLSGVEVGLDACQRRDEAKRVRPPEPCKRAE